MESVTLEEQLATLRSDDLSQLKEQRKTLEECWLLLRHVRWEDSVLKQLQQEAHALAGSGDNYGFVRLSERGHELEAVLVDLRKRPDLVSEERFSRLEEILHATCEEVDSVLELSQRVPLTREPDERQLAILDPDPGLSQRLRLWCEAWGYEVSLHTSLSSLLEESVNCRFELVLADPQACFSVNELLHELRNRLQEPVPVVVLSDRTDLTARLEALRAGAVGYITRPLEEEDLKAVLKRVFRSTQAEPPRVLLLESDRAQAEDWKTILENHDFSVQVLNDPWNILDEMKHHRPDVLLVNDDMAEIRGLELGRLLHQDRRYLHLPIVFIADTEPEEKDRASSTVAGDDYLVKPVSERRLIDTLNRRLARSRQVAENLVMINVSQSEKGLENRGHFFQRLEKDLARYRMAGKDSGDLLLYLVADKQPFLHQRHGVIGSATLGSAVEHWLAERPEIAGRGCALSDLSWLVRVRLSPGASAVSTAEQLRQELARTAFHLEGKPQRLSISAGGAVLSADLPDAGRVTRAVENACVKAAMAGGGKTIMVGAGRQPDYMPLENRLAKALKESHFALQFQPVVNLETNTSNFQALLRLRDDEGNLYLPDEFLPHVRDTVNDGVAGMDRWVIEAALSALKDRGSQEGSVIIKLSTDIPALVELLPFISRVLEENPLRSNRLLYVAFPQDFLVEHLDAMRSLTEKLTRLGIGIVVDNFGADHSGYPLLQELPELDYVRLDADWNRYVHDRRKRSEMEGAVMSRFGSMDRIIACRVEEAKSFSAFWDMGVRHFQGYFVQQPGDAMLLE